MNKKHVVFFNQYYPPDLAPTGVVLRDVAEKMVTQGNRVTIVCSRGGYSEKGGTEKQDETSAIQVIRVPTFQFGRHNNLGKVCDYASFYFFAFWAGLLLKGKPSLFVALTTPPYLSVLVRVVSKLQGGCHAHWVMDIYPDVMVAHGLLSAESRKARFLWAVSKWGFGGPRNRGTVSLGPDMASKLETFHGVKNSSWIPLWSTAKKEESAAETSRKLRKERGWDGKVVFLYSGNMGLGHRLNEFLTLAKDQKENEEVLFAFYGGGKRRIEVESFLKEYPEAPVELGDYVPGELLEAHLLSADIHLASLEPSWDGCMVPSKIQGIFASRRPVLFVGSDSSSIGNWILSSGAGWVATEGLSLSQSCFKEAMDESIRKSKGEKGYRFSQVSFEPGKNQEAVAKVFS